MSTGNHTGRPQFDFEKLDVYHAAANFYHLVRAIIRSLPTGYSEEISQFRRAALSIVLNICEASGEFSRAERARFYRMALRSANECGGLLRILMRDLGDRKQLDDACELLLRIIAMLTGLVNYNSKRQFGLVLVLVLVLESVTKLYLLFTSPA